MLNLFPQTAKINKNHLTIGGCDTVSLAEEFGTPLYIFDEATLRGKCSEYRKAFEKRYPNSTISYACKAYINKALAQIFNEEGLSLDAVSAGEIAIEMPASRRCAVSQACSQDHPRQAHHVPLHMFPLNFVVRPAT